MRLTLNIFLVQLLFIYSFVRCQQYLGCFKDDGKNHVFGHFIIYTKTLTPDVCISHCQEYGYTFIGLQYGNECFCGDVAPDNSLKLDESECNFRCSGTRRQMCGGNFRNSVYKIINPKEGYENMGCYVPGDNPLRSFFKNYDKNLIPYLCIEFCKGNNYAFAQLQFGSLCSCENQTLPENTKIADKDCNLKCTGDQTKICGGFFKNTVYYTGLTPAKPEEYVGCYQEYIGRIRMFGHKKEFSNTLTYRACLNYCKNLGYSYCGLRNGSQCLCGDEAPYQRLKLDDDDCNINCSGDDKQNCGGTLKNSVYKIKYFKEGFEYEGCFLDQQNPRKHPDYFIDYGDELIPFVCINMCKENGYKYAGLQNRSQCFCEKELPSYTKKVADGQCDLRCSGDLRKFCGSAWRNSIYNTGLSSSKS